MINLNYLIVFCFGSLTACIILGGTVAFQNNISLNSINNINLLNGESNCANLSLQKTAICLNEELSKWWKYNASNTNKYSLSKNIDWNVIKNEGGVCWHSAEWYIKEAKNLGFNAQEEIIFKNSTYAHEWAVIWDENLTGYCILDQQSMPKCLSLGVPNE